MQAPLCGPCEPLRARLILADPWGQRLPFRLPQEHTGTAENQCETGQNMGRGLALCSPIKNLATLCQSWDRPLKGQALSADALQLMKGLNPPNPLQYLRPAPVLSRVQYRARRSSPR